MKTESTNKLKRPPASTPELYGQEELGDNALVFAHYFLPGTSADWYVTEYNPIEEIIYGWAEIVPGFGEWGYTSLVEFEQIALPFVLEMNGEKQESKYRMHVEFDLHWNIRTVREILANRK